MATEQRQDSLSEQLQTVIDLATDAGCYDAADWIQAVGLPRTCSGPSRAVLAMRRGDRLEVALRSIADTLNDESLPITDAAATAYRLCDEALSAPKGSGG